MKAMVPAGKLPIRGTLLLAVAVAVALTAGVPPTLAQDDESAGFAVFSGRVTFQRYCASCHGREALGDGNIAQYLRIPPADLTQLSNENGGEFPEERVYEFIDGRLDVRGHGTREMPVWGDVFQSSLVESATGEEDGEARAGRIISQLVKYIESIQVEGGARLTGDGGN